MDDLLPEAYATVREASVRVLGMRHFRVQLVGGVVLHQGRIAEMKTGEGKTLVSTLPAYLNALTGEGVHIVTVNDHVISQIIKSEFVICYVSNVAVISSTTFFFVHTVQYYADCQSQKFMYLSHPL